MATQPIARDWVEHRFYFAPQVATLLIVLLVLRVFRSFLREQGVRLRDFLRSSVVGPPVRGRRRPRRPPRPAPRPGGGRRAGRRRRGPLPREGARLRAPLAHTASPASRSTSSALGLFLLTLRSSRPRNPDLLSAKEALPFAGLRPCRGALPEGGGRRGGQAGLPEGKAPGPRRRARDASGERTPRGRALERGGGRLRVGGGEGLGGGGRRRQGGGRKGSRARGGAAVGPLGPARRGRRGLRRRRWPSPTPAGGSPRGRPSAAGKNALWKRAGETARAAGRTLEAAEAFRLGGEPLLAGPLYLAAGRPLEAAQELERGGDLPGAAEAFAKAGQEKTAAELIARDLEGKADWAGAADAWAKAEKWEKAALLYERTGQPAEAARAFRESGKLERAAALFQKAGPPAGGRCRVRGGGEGRDRGRHLPGAAGLGTRDHPLPCRREVRRGGARPPGEGSVRRGGFALPARRPGARGGAQLASRRAPRPGLGPPDDRPPRRPGCLRRLPRAGGSAPRPRTNRGTRSTSCASSSGTGRSIPRRSRLTRRSRELSRRRATSPRRSRSWRPSRRSIRASATPGPARWPSARG